jgi:pimeloyl-ACP methyl ester carboxylesterase
MTSLVMRPLARHLRDCGFDTVLFNYHSLLSPLSRNAARLAQLLRARGEDRVHLVGHSLGGLVILQALQDHPDLLAGRIVLLGCPVRGSVVARRLHGRRYSRWLIGRSDEHGLLGGGVHWRGGASLAIIAGNRPIGIGQLLGGFSGPNDGTVEVAETVPDVEHQSIAVDTTHTGLLFSADVARVVCSFLHQGRLDATG